MEKTNEPMERQGIWEIIKDIPRRLVSVVWQIIGSRKTYVLLLTAFLIMKGSIPESSVGYVWLVAIIFYIGGIEALKMISNIKK